MFIAVVKSKLPSNVIRHLEIQKGSKEKWTIKKIRDLLCEYVVASEKAEKVQNRCSET